MALLQQLFGFTLRQVLDADLLENVNVEAIGNLAGSVGGRVVAVVADHFRDHSQTLPRALQRANDNAWDAFGVALAGDGFLDKGMRWFASGDARGLREQVQLFLQDNPLPFAGRPAEFRGRCLAQYQRAHQAKLFDLDTLSPGAIGQQAARFARYTDRAGLIRGANEALVDVAGQLNEQYPDLAWLLQQPAADGVPLLVAVFTFFFHLEIETDKRLYQGLSFQYLRKLTAAQDFLTTTLEQLRQGQEAQQALLKEIREEIRQGNDRKRRGVSFVDDREEDFLRQALERFRQLPPDLQRADDRANLAACLGEAGLYDLAREEHDQAARTAQQENNQALAAAEHFQAYQSACEKQQWAAALTSLQAAAKLDERFELFPLHRYPPKRILGSGGFGTVFLCEDLDMGGEVAIKAIHNRASDLDRNVGKMLQEAHTLKGLVHPGIIGVRDGTYADRARMRAYIVMDYFQGSSLAVRLEKFKTLTVAEFLVVARQVAGALHAAHCAQPEPVYHRDVKPDNLLVSKEGELWHVKVIDFGLAVRPQAIHQSVSRPVERRSLKDQSYAGTLKYAPPEQKGELTAPVGAYSDIYAFGRTCCEMLFGFPTLNRHYSDKKNPGEPQPHHYNRKQDPLPPALVELLERCLQHAVFDRPQNFQEVLDVLETVAAELDPEKRLQLLPPVKPAQPQPIQGQLQQIQMDAEVCSDLIRDGKSSSVHLKQVWRERLGVWKQHARQGMAEAQWLYADCLLEGIGLTKDVKAAATWFRKAAEQGLALAQMSLGNRYWRGEGVPEDANESLKWYRQAANQGQPTALAILQRLTREVMADLAECERLIERGENSREHLKQVSDNMLDVWANFAKEGMAEAQLLFADCLLEGVGWDKDSVTAVKWFRKAAEQGLASAQMSLGNRYWRGDGVTKDTTEALKWYRKAASQGLPSAQTLLKRLERIANG